MGLLWSSFSAEFSYCSPKFGCWESILWSIVFLKVDFPHLRVRHFSNISWQNPRAFCLSTCEFPLDSCHCLDIEKYTRYVRAGFSKACLAALAMSRENGTITFCDDPNVFKRIVHPLRMSHLRHNKNLVENLCSLNRCYEARHNLHVRFNIFESFKLIICIITCLQN